MIYIYGLRAIADPLLPCATYEIKFVNYYAQIINHELNFVYSESYEIFFVNPGSYFPGGHYYMKGLFISDQLDVLNPYSINIQTIHTRLSHLL